MASTIRILYNFAAIALFSAILINLLLSAEAVTKPKGSPFVKKKVDAPKYPQCPRSPCESFTLEQTVLSMWNLPAYMSPLINKYKTAIAGVIHTVSPRQLGMLVAHTLWSVDMMTDLPTSIHPTCVYGNLINKTLAYQEKSSSCNRKELNKAIMKYGDLCDSAINYTVFITLSAAGCPATVPKVVLDPKEGNGCPLGGCVHNMLKDKNLEIPQALQDVLEEMLESDDEMDVAVATAIVGASTKSSVDMFEKYLANPELLNVMRLKCCNLKIPRHCCQAREADIRNRCNSLIKRTDANLDALIPDSDDDDD